MHVSQHSNGDDSAARGQSSNETYAYQKYTDIPTQAIRPLLFCQASLSSETFPLKRYYLYFWVIFLECERRNPCLSHQSSLQDENRRANLRHEIPYQPQIQYQISDHLVSKWSGIWCALLFKHYQSRSCSPEDHIASYTPLSPIFKLTSHFSSVCPPPTPVLPPASYSQQKYLWLYKHLIQTHSRSGGLGTHPVWRSALAASPLPSDLDLPHCTARHSMPVVRSNQDNEAFYVISVPLANCDFMSHAQH